MLCEDRPASPGGGGPVSPTPQMIGREGRSGRPWVQSLLVIVTLTCCRTRDKSRLLSEPLPSPIN